MFCSVGEDSNDYGIMLQRLTANFNEKHQLDEVNGFIFLRTCPVARNAIKIIPMKDQISSLPHFVTF
jgi:hypothetical protein